MRKARFKETEIVRVLKEVEGGDMDRRHGQAPSRQGGDMDRHHRGDRRGGDVDKRSCADSEPGQTHINTDRPLIGLRLGGVTPVPSPMSRSGKRLVRLSDAPRHAVLDVAKHCRDYRQKALAPWECTRPL